MIEDILGRNLARNFPTIDRFLNGVATSIKSLDLRAATYQYLPNLASRIRGYVISVQQFNGAGTITNLDILQRELALAIPAGAATPEQWAILQELVQWAQTIGVTLSIFQVP